MLCPAFPACSPFNREGSWRFRPTVWFFHAWLFVEVAHGALERFLRQAVFDQRVVLAINLHRTQGDNFATAGVDDANVFTLEDARENSAQALAGLVRL